MNPITHPQTNKQVQNFIKQPAHGLGLTGLPGSGKQYLARYLAQKITKNSQTSSPYTKEVIAGEDGIDAIREVQKFLHLKVPGTESIRRVVVIANAEDFRHEAQNALLKTLEEPPEDTLLVLTTSDISGLLPTVRSRLQWVEVKPISADQALKEFAHGYKSDEIKKAWLISQGCAGLMAGLLEHDTKHPLVASVDQARALLQASAYQRISKVDSLVKDKDFSLDLLLDGMNRLLYTALQVAIKKGSSQKEIARLKDQVKLVLMSQKYAKGKVQPKLLLTNLFYSL